MHTRTSSAMAVAAADRARSKDGLVNEFRNLVCRGDELPCSTTSVTMAIAGTLRRLLPTTYQLYLRRP